MERCFFQLAYLGPGGPEFMLVMLVLLLMFGAKEAPRILRKLNDIINQIRSTADGFKREVMYGDLHAEPPVYDVAEDEDEQNEEPGDDQDPDHDEDYDYDRHAADESSGNVEAEPEEETSGNGEDDDRKD